MVVQVARARPPPLAGVEPEVTVGPGAHPSHGMPWAARLGPGVTVFFCIINHTKGSLFIEVIAKLQHGQNST